MLTHEFHPTAQTSVVATPLQDLSLCENYYFFLVRTWTLYTHCPLRCFCKFFRLKFEAVKGRCSNIFASKTNLRVCLMRNFFFSFRNLHKSLNYANFLSWNGTPSLYLDMAWMTWNFAAKLLYPSLTNNYMSISIFEKYPKLSGNNQN